MRRAHRLGLHEGEVEEAIVSVVNWMPSRSPSLPASTGQVPRTPTERMVSRARRGWREG